MILCPPVICNQLKFHHLITLHLTKDTIIYTSVLARVHNILLYILCTLGIRGAIIMLE